MQSGTLFSLFILFLIALFGRLPLRGSLRSRAPYGRPLRAGALSHATLAHRWRGHTASPVFYAVIVASLFLTSLRLNAQETIQVKGYVYAANNSGFLEGAAVIVDSAGIIVRDTIYTDYLGGFECQINPGFPYKITASYKWFVSETQTVEAISPDSNAVFLKFPLNRMPGYIFDATLADVNPSPDDTLSGGGSFAIEGATIEVFNTITKMEELRLINHPEHTFKMRLEQGNQYVMLIRKAGYYNKWIKINVNVNGCILCFEGIGSVSPGVVDNLTRNNTMGLLVANIGLKKIELNKGIKLENIYYDLAKYDIRPDAKPILDNLVDIMRDNPQIVIELRSHTDVRGDDKSNQILSQNRAQAAVEYIVSRGVDTARIAAVGYGESLLVNDCKNGVYCSEEKHQENRRTEFAVVHILPNAMDSMSLRSIMLEREIEALATAETKTNVKVKANNVVQVPVKTVDTMYINPPPVKPSQSTIVEVLVEPKPKTNTGLQYSKAIPIPANFEGYAIELMQSNDRLDDANIIFKQYNTVYELPSEQGFSYICGNFPRLKSAEMFLKNSIIEVYPNAFIVEFKAGKRVAAK